MNGGPIGSGLKYFASIEIQGNLTQAQLTAVVNQIQTALNAPGVVGTITAEARVTTTTKPIVSFTIP